MKKIALLCAVLLAGLQSMAQLGGIGTAIPESDSTIPEEKVVTNPDELRKLGVSEEVIQELTGMRDGMVSDSQKLKNLLAIEEPSAEELSRIEGIRNRLAETKLAIIRKAFSLPEPVVYGHEFFRRSNISMDERPFSAKAPENYLIGPGDDLNISIWGYSDLNQTYTVDRDGSINAPYVGKVNLKGLTYAKAREAIKSRFGKVYDLRNSNIDINLIYSRVITVNIVGEVFQPGTYTFPARNSAFNALVAINGPNQIGSVRNIKVRRGGQVIRELDVYKYLQMPVEDQDFFLEDNDYIIVGSLGKVVTIEGEVRRPGKYELLGNEDMDELIKFAGGLSAAAYKRVVQVKRFQSSSQVLIDVNYERMANTQNRFPLFDGDLVTIGAIPEGLKKFVSIDGEISLPGEYEFKNGDRVLDIIEAAGGPLETALNERMYLVRESDDLTKKYVAINLGSVLGNPSSEQNVPVQNFDEIRILSKETFVEDDSVKVFGSVKSPGNFVFAAGMNLSDLLFMAGGFLPEAANDIIEISRVTISQGEPTTISILKESISSQLTINEGAENFILQPFDQIFVRSVPEFQLQRNIVITGEVKYPGTYSLVNKREKVSDIIERTGGATNSAFLNGATLIRKEGDQGQIILDLEDILSNKKSRFNFVLTDGDSIHVPKVKNFVRISGAINYPLELDKKILEDSTLEKNELLDLSLKLGISAPFHNRRSAKYYIQNYGAGFDEEAKRSTTIVKQPGGLVQRTRNFGLFKIYPRVKQGAEIFVDYKPEKAKKDQEAGSRWNETFQTIVTSATALLTLVLLYRTATRD